MFTYVIYLRFEHVKIINVCELSSCCTDVGGPGKGLLTDLLLGHRCNNQGINVTLVKRLEQIQNSELMADVRVKLLIPIETKYRDFLIMVNKFIREQ